MQQLQLMQQRNAQLQRRDPNNPALGDGVMRQPSASVLAMKMYEERMKHAHSMDSETSPALIDANRMAFLKPATNPQRYICSLNFCTLVLICLLHFGTTWMDLYCLITFCII